MSHRHRRPFKKSQKSPFDNNGPNHAALRRGLEWLQTHGPNAPSPHVTVEIPRPEEKIPTQTKEDYAPPAPPAAEPAIETPEPDTPQPEPAETETSQPEAIETEAAKPEPSQTESTESQATESETTEMEITEDQLTDEEEARIEAAESGAAESAARDHLLDARRFPKHYPAPIEPHRHERRCSICNHQDRDAIEEAFLDWRRPGDIRFEFNLASRTAIYRHAHALGLFEQRARAMRHVLEKIMEESTRRDPSADAMIRAVRAYSCLDETGRWIEPPRRLIISREPYPPRPLPPGREIAIEPEGAEREA